MNVRMVTTESIRDIKVNWVSLNTESGSLVIMPGHAPELVLLAPNQPISMQLPGGAVKTLSLLHGIAHIDRTQVLIICEV